MTVLPDLPVELDPAYVQPDSDAGPARRPRVGEWVQGMFPVPNGEDGVRPGQDHMYGRVAEVVEGDYQHGGCVVQPWRRAFRSFGPAVFVPWCCIHSRTTANRYSLTGEI